MIPPDPKDVLFTGIETTPGTLMGPHGPVGAGDVPKHVHDAISAHNRELADATLLTAASFAKLESSPGEVPGTFDHRFIFGSPPLAWDSPPIAVPIADLRRISSIFDTLGKAARDLEVLNKSLQAIRQPTKEAVDEFIRHLRPSVRRLALRGPYNYGVPRPIQQACAFNRRRNGNPARMGKVVRVHEKPRRWRYLYGRSYR